MMKLQNYEKATYKTIQEVKYYLLQISDGYYMQDIHDMMNKSIDIPGLKRRINKRKDIQLWLFSKIKKCIDKSLTYDEMENHLIMMNHLIYAYYKPLLEYKYNLFYYIIERQELSLDIYCLLRHLINYKKVSLEEFIKSITVYKGLTEYEYHHISSEILLLEKQYKQSYKHLPYIYHDQSIKRFYKALYNDSPYQFEKHFKQKHKSFQIVMEK